MNNEMIKRIISLAEEESKGVFDRIDEVALINQRKVLNAFRKEQVALRHFSPTTGYGYDDIGRDTLCRIYADVFGAERGLVSPNISSGTHALTIALFGILRPGDTILSITGDVYDTLSEVLVGENIGSLLDFGITYEKVDLINGAFDIQKINYAIREYYPKVIYIQRSKGYEWRDALSIQQISEIVMEIRKVCDCTIMVDNCYGEFVDEYEPTQVGCNLAVGSLIKNVGGGIAQSGGYIVGDAALIDLCARRLISPSTGNEVGSYAHGYQQLYQGLFMAPHVVAQALKTSSLFAYALSYLGYDVLPLHGEMPNDIICSVKLNDKGKLIDFCRAIQAASPVDSFVVATPWAMPGYTEQVIMAAGCFVQGASIELSCDAPLKPPYIVYLQGGLTYEHGKIALEEVLCLLE